MPIPQKGKATMLWMALGVFLALVACITVYKTWSVLFPDIASLAPLDPNCDLRAGPCISVLPNGSQIGFRIEPQEIPVLKPLRLAVDVDGVDVETVEVDFAGTDMNMGYNRVILQKHSGDVWRGQGMLPVCVRNSMNWEATVMLKTDQGLMVAPFRFDAYRK